MNWSTIWPPAMAKTAGMDWTAKVSEIARVLVHVDLGQLDLAPGRLDGLFEHGAERPTRPAPGRPEVDDDGHGGAPLDHLGLESLVGDVHQSSDATG